MFYILLVYFTLCLRLLTGSSHADQSGEPKYDCLTRHVRDAKAENSRRMELYALRTDGRSRSLSLSLISGEGISLWTTVPALDRAARPYQDLGVRILCDDVVPISTAAKFTDEVKLPPDSGPYQSPNAGKFSRLASRAHKLGGFSGVEQVARDALRELNRQPGYHCLYRHFVESVLRASVLAPRYQSEVREINSAYTKPLLKDPGPLSWWYIWLTIKSLGFAEHTDKKAAEFQKVGVPIFCQDLPTVPDPRSISRD